jgi:hypothetical protein
VWGSSVWGSSVSSKFWAGALLSCGGQLAAPPAAGVEAGLEEMQQRLRGLQRRVPRAGKAAGPRRRSDGGRGGGGAHSGGKGTGGG